MAWGYWSATSVSDRGRSPRRNKEPAQSNIHTSQPPIAQTQPQTVIKNLEEPPTVAHQNYATVIANTSTAQMAPAELEEVLPDHQLSRRPSLDLAAMMVPQGTLAGIMCHAHGSRHGGTLSAGNTLTRMGSRHTAVEYAVPHHFHHHHAYVEYHQSHLSLSDDDSSSEPGYDSIRSGVVNDRKKHAGFSNTLLRVISEISRMESGSWISHMVENFQDLAFTYATHVMLLFPNTPPQSGIPCQSDDRKY
ncbi:hypothetical protein GWI33_020059 [Rhynchophorus ferrugineus]|uniref:Uncharacterized protein n=1 Tax=Rhynchophorus ferrugineus TaxID=354439 RepID=A0A834M4I8_RHYFE|nr:hypothetical protein GWI33_020059 [Rhynchophorus ferrugineus]